MFLVLRIDGRLARGSPSLVNGVGLRLPSLSVESIDEEGFVGSNPTPRTSFLDGPDSASRSPESGCEL